MKREREQVVREIVFGQTFFPDGDEANSLFVVTDTVLMDTDFVGIVAASEIIFIKKGRRTVKRLDLPQSFEFSRVRNLQSVWTLRQVIQATKNSWGNHNRLGNWLKRLEINSKLPPALV